MSQNNLIALLDKKRVNLSNTENQVLDYIFENIEKISQQTIYEVAQDLFVSTATISRTAKHLGYKGFQDFKYAILQNVHEEEQTQDFDSFQHITKEIVDNVSDSFQMINEEKVLQMVSMIQKANFIEVFGLGGSLPLCIDFARKLTFLGKKASARLDWDEQEAIAKNLDEQDLAIFVSFTGETHNIVKHAKIVSEKKVPIISLISTKGSTLEKMSDMSVFAKGTTHYYGNVDLSSRISVICLVDAVLLMYAQRARQVE